jgi:hypothetical protein
MRICDCRFAIADLRLPIWDCRFGIADLRLPIWDCRFAIADLGLFVVLSLARFFRGVTFGARTSELFQQFCYIQKRETVETVPTEQRYTPTPN